MSKKAERKYRPQASLTLETVLFHAEHLFKHGYVNDDSPQLILIAGDGSRRKKEVSLVALKVSGAHAGLPEEGIGTGGVQMSQAVTLNFHVDEKGDSDVGEAYMTLAHILKLGFEGLGMTRIVSASEGRKLKKEYEKCKKN